MSSLLRQRRISFLRKMMSCCQLVEHRFRLLVANMRMRSFTRRVRFFSTSHQINLYTNSVKDCSSCGIRGIEGNLPLLKTVTSLQNRDIFTRALRRIQFRRSAITCKTVRKTGELTAYLTEVPADSFWLIERNDYCSRFHAAATMVSAS